MGRKLKAIMVVAAITAFYCSWVVLAKITEVPEPAIVAIETTPNTEAFLAGQVQHGTFKIRVSLSDLMERARKSGGKVTIEYGSISYSVPVLEYWLAEEALFYHAVVTMSQPWGERWSGLEWDRVEILGSNAVIYPSTGGRKFGGGILAFMGAVLLGFGTLSKKKVESAKHS